METNELSLVARKIRGRIIEMSHVSGAPHLASALSCVDILVAAYGQVLKVDPAHPDAPDRDRLILSKGHAAMALYSTLAFMNFFDGKLLDTFAQDGGCLQEHPGPRCVPGVEAATGSLGHGLSVGIGMALAGRIQSRSYGVFVVMSDGECNEGSVWEGAMFAAGRKLDQLTVIVDYNKWQATGRSNEVMALSPLMEKWMAFGWDAQQIDGHDFNALTRVLKRNTGKADKPRAIIANTVKGKGVSFMEDDNNWHYRIPTDDEVRKAHGELHLL